MRTWGQRADGLPRRIQGHVQEVGRPQDRHRQADHAPVPRGDPAEAAALPRSPRPQPLRGRHGEVHRLRAVRRRLPGASASTCGAATTIPRTRPRPGERYGFVYEINYLRCIHCDLCVEACPTEAITETKLFEFAFTNRSDAIYTKDELRGRRRRPAPAAAVGELGRRVRSRGRHVGMDAGDRAGRQRPSSRASWPGPVSWATACARGGWPAARGRARPSEAAAAEAATMTTTTGTGATDARRDAHLPAGGRHLPRSVPSASCCSGTRCTTPSAWSPRCSGSRCCSSPKGAYFLAAIQVIVYAGAIVVLFLFVIMLLGVDRAVGRRTRSGPRPASDRDRRRPRHPRPVPDRPPRRDGAGDRYAVGGRAPRRRIGRHQPPRSGAVHRLHLRRRDHRGAADRRRRRRGRAGPPVDGRADRSRRVPRRHRRRAISPTLSTTSRTCRSTTTSRRQTRPTPPPNRLTTDGVRRGCRGRQRRGVDADVLD